MSAFIVPHSTTSIKPRRVYVKACVKCIKAGTSAALHSSAASPGWHEDIPASLWRAVAACVLLAPALAAHRVYRKHDAPSTELVYCAVKQIFWQGSFGGPCLQLASETLLNGLLKLLVANILTYALLVFAHCGIAIRASDEQNRR